VADLHALPRHRAARGCTSARLRSAEWLRPAATPSHRHRGGASRFRTPTRCCRRGGRPDQNQVYPVTSKQQQIANGDAGRPGGERARTPAMTDNVRRTANTLEGGSATTCLRQRRYRTRRVEHATSGVTVSWHCRARRRTRQPLAPVRYFDQLRDSAVQGVRRLR